MSPSYSENMGREEDVPMSLRAGQILGPKIPGYNVDKINVEAGLRELDRIGFKSKYTIMVIEYQLQRWARGEEAQAERGAIDLQNHGIDLTSWRRVLAAAMAGAQ